MPASILITGGAGFIGCNLADALLRAGETVVIADVFSRPGSFANARWLRSRHGDALRVERVDVRDAAAMQRLVMQADTVFHLAAQVAVTTSMVDPRLDFETNLLGTLNVLEAARGCAQPPAVVFTSTNKVYGSLEHLAVDRTETGYRFRDGRAGVPETEPLDFHSPYGCSKGGAGQYVRDYARIYGIPTVVFRMSCIYGEHQHGTEDQGWIGHFARAILAGEPITLYGDGYQVRDVLWVDDLVAALRSAAGAADALAGRTFNIGGGPANAVAIRDVAERLMALAGREVPLRNAEWRPGDQRIFVTDVSRARAELDWEPEVPVREGLGRMIRWLRAEQAPRVGERRARSRADRVRPAAGGGA